MTSQPIDRQHPLTEFVDALAGRLGCLATTPVWSMPAEEQRHFLVTMAGAKAQIEALELQVLAEAERSGATTDSGANTAADWVAVETRQTRRDARSDLRLAEKLDQHYHQTATAMAQGKVNTAQARAIVACLDKLPVSGEFAVDAEQRDAAEAHLVAASEHHDAKALRILGGRIFEVIAPDLAEKYDGQALEREEAEALRRTTLTMWEDDQGTWHGRFRIPALHGQMLTKMILALSSPARNAIGSGTGESGEVNDPAVSGIDPDLPTPVRHGIALTQLIENYPADKLPKTGGCTATIVVTMTLQQLLADLETAGVVTLDTGSRISASQARRLACTAGIIPVVLGGHSQVLDAGRKRRLHTEAMRLAMGVRDKGCTATDCESPPGLCHAHHDTPWSHGGSTSVETGRLLCPHHHRRIHDPKFETRHHPNGTVSFHRRT